MDIKLILDLIDNEEIAEAFEVMEEEGMNEGQFFKLRKEYFEELIDEDFTERLRAFVRFTERQNSPKAAPAEVRRTKAPTEKLLSTEEEKIRVSDLIDQDLISKALERLCEFFEKRNRPETEECRAVLGQYRLAMTDYQIELIDAVDWEDINNDAKEICLELLEKM